MSGLVEQKDAEQFRLEVYRAVVQVVGLRRNTYIDEKNHYYDVLAEAKRVYAWVVGQEGTK